MDLFLLEGLQDIIDAIVLDRLQGEFVIGGTKNDGDHHIDMPEDLEALTVCQLNVKEQQIQVMLMPAKVVHRLSHGFQACHDHEILVFFNDFL